MFTKVGIGAACIYICIKKLARNPANKQNDEGEIYMLKS